MTSTSVSLLTSSTADIVGLVSDVQKSVGNSGISHFWVKPETQTPGPAFEAALAAAAQALILYSPGRPNALPASATDYAGAENRSATSSPNSPSRNLIKTARNSSPIERHFFLPWNEWSELLRHQRATVMYGSMNLRSAMKTAKVGSPV